MNLLWIFFSNFMSFVLCILKMAIFWIALLESHTVYIDLAENCSLFVHIIFHAYSNRKTVVNKSYIVQKLSEYIYCK
jgi:hypothetical protein